MIKSEYVFPIPEGVKLNYTKAGEATVLEAKNIILYAPHVRSLKTVAPLKQEFIRAIMSQSATVQSPEMQQLVQEVHDKNEVGEKEGLKASEIMTIIGASKETDLTSFLEQFMKVLKDPQLARIDGEEDIKDSFLTKLPVEVLENIAGEYLANFIAPSVI